MLITQGSLVRNQPDPPSAAGQDKDDNAIPGGLAQLGEHLLCKQGVVGSIPSSSTNNLTRKLITIKKLLVCAINTKAALQKAALMLIDIDRSIGCSLKIHRVKSVLLMETAHS